MGGERRREKSLRIGVHHADAVVWGPVCNRTRLSAPPARFSGNAATSPMAYTLFGSIPSPDAANVPSTAMPPVGAGAAASRANGSIGAPRADADDDDVALERRAAVELRVASGWSSKASVGVERRRGRGLKPRDGRRETPGKVLKDRRPPRERGRMGTSANTSTPAARPSSPAMILATFAPR